MSSPLSIKVPNGASLATAASCVLGARPAASRFQLLPCWTPSIGWQGALAVGVPGTGWIAKPPRSNVGEACPGSTHAKARLVRCRAAAHAAAHAAVVCARRSCSGCARRSCCAGVCLSVFVRRSRLNTRTTVRTFLVCRQLGLGLVAHHGRSVRVAHDPIIVQICGCSRRSCSGCSRRDRVTPRCGWGTPRLGLWDSPGLRLGPWHLTQLMAAHAAARAACELVAPCQKPLDAEPQLGDAERSSRSAAAPRP